MIQLKINGRAGNQFFQYAFVNNYILDNNLNEKIYISFEDLEKRKTDNSSFVNELKNFNINNIEEITKIRFNNKQRVLDFIYKVFVKVIRFKAKIYNNFKTKSHVQIVYGRRTGIHGNIDCRPRSNVLRSMESTTLGKRDRRIRLDIRNILYISRYHSNARCCAADRRHRN